MEADEEAEEEAVEALGKEGIRMNVDVVGGVPRIVGTATNFNVQNPVKWYNN